MTDTQTKALGAAALLIVVAVGWFWLSDKDTDTTCALTGAAVAVAAEGLTHGRSPSQIAMVTGGGVLASGACKKALDTWYASPSQSVTVTVGGETLNVEGSDLRVNLVPQPTCDDWLLLTFRQMCYDGRLQPPVSG